MLRHTRVNLGQVATYQTDRVARTPQTCSSIFISIALQHLKDSRGGEIKEHCWFPSTKKKHAPLLYTAVNWLQEPGSDKSIHYHMSEKAAAALVWGSGDSSNLFPLKYRQAPQVSPGTASAFFFFFFYLICTFLWPKSVKIYPSMHPSDLSSSCLMQPALFIRL